MTFRAILIGLLFSMGIAVFGYFNDWIMEQAFLATNLVPIAVYGFLVVGLLGVTPLLRACRLKGLAAKEWCVITALMLVACAIPGPGLMWYFSNTLVTPHRQNTISIGWRKHQLISYVPKVMLTDPHKDKEQDPSGKFYQDVVGGFKAGLPGGKVSVKQVPWKAWSRTLTFWLPLLGLSFVAGIFLILVVHQQWSKRERLRYPMAYVASEMIGGWRQGEHKGVFRNRMFWLGFLIPLIIILINGYSKWNISSISIPLKVELEGALGTKWPVIYNVQGEWWIFNPELFFSVVGFAYFVSSDISFSIGINGLVYAAIFLVLYVVGVDVTGGAMSGSLHSFQLFGSYLGIGLVIFYTGRKFYLTVLAKAFCIPADDPVERGIVWACRIALLTAVAMVVMLVVALDMDWLLAILFVMLVGMMFLVLTRINVETGLFMIQPGWYAVSVLLAMFGFGALGPHMLIILGILSLVLTVDPLVCIMPLAANALKLGEGEGVGLGRLSGWLTVSILLALVTGVIGTIAVQYGHGGTKYTWADKVAKQPFSLLERNLQIIDGDPSVKQGLELGKTQPNTKFMYAIGVGVLIALGLSTLRLRYTWWPIHPVLFLIWGTFPGFTLGASFLLGWIIKSAISTLGGGQSYRSAKPLFIGLIAGEFAAAIIWSIVGVTYYLVTGLAGPEIRIFPA